MSQTADTYFEKTIARFRKVLSPTVIPISLPREIPSPPTPRKAPPKAALRSSDDINKLSEEHRKARRYIRKTLDHKEPHRPVTYLVDEESNITYASDPTQGDKVNWNSAELAVYPCEHQTKRWGCAENCVHARRRPRAPACHCSRCQEPQCPGRPAASEPGPNVVTYADTCTMTLQRADAATSQQGPPESRPPAPAADPNQQPPQACQPGCPFLNDLDASPNGTVREFIVVKCPTCHQTVTTPVDDSNNKYELVSVQQKRCYFGIPVDSNMGGTLLNSPFYTMPEPIPCMNYDMRPSSSPERLPGPRPGACPCTGYRSPAGESPERRRSPPAWRRARPRSEYRAKAPRPPEPARGASRYHEHCVQPGPVPLPVTRLPAAPRRRVVSSARPCRRPCFRCPAE